MSIKLIDLTKRFGDTLVINRLSLEVRDGELFVLLGSSGSGKSTVLRMIAGLTPLDAGRIELDGRDVTQLPPQARGTGFVFQNYSIFRHMTAAENVAFGLRIRNTPAEERRRRSEALLDLVGLSGLGARFPEQLSGGQRQRVALARALAYQPSVLLLDEPFGALDVKIRAQLRESLKDIQRQVKVTTILVTHDQEEAFELGDRIGIVERGSLIEVGTPEELYHRPQTEIAATFIGGGNVLVGRAEQGRIRLGSAALPFPEAAPAHDDGAPVRLLFRPETVALQSQPFVPGGPILPLARGQVVERIFAGPVRRVRLEVDGLQGVRPLVPPPVYGRRMTQIEAVQESAHPSAAFAPGQSLWIGLSSYHVLAPTGLKVLIAVDRSASGDAVAAVGGCLARAAGGPAALLGVTDSAHQSDEARARLESLARSHAAGLAHLDLRLRQGHAAEEILLEAQEGLYEVIVIGRHGESRRAGSAGIGSTAQYVLRHAEAPVLLVDAPRPSIERILICTAAGEPGKTDVRFGGRVARRTHAAATVLHVRPAQATRDAAERAETHLRQAQASLEALGVSSRVKIEDRAPLLEGILSEAEAGDYDLLVIGAPAPRDPQRMRWSDMAAHIIDGTQRPVLVVPMEE